MGGVANVVRSVITKAASAIGVAKRQTAEAEAQPAGQGKTYTQAQVNADATQSAVAARQTSTMLTGSAGVEEDPTKTSKILLGQ